MAEYIEREALLNRLETHIRRITPIEESRDMFFHDSGLNAGVTGAVLEVKNAPAADVAPVVHGRWEKASETMPIYRCSICNERNLFKNGDNVFSNYCPNCGARMDGE